MRKIKSNKFIKEKGWLLSYWQEKKSYCISVDTAINVTAIIARYDIRTDSIVLCYKLPLSIVDEIYKIVEIIEKDEERN